MKVGIVHNAYLMKGGEDFMVEQEYLLLKRNNVAVEKLIFNNPNQKLQQFVDFLMASYNPFSSRRFSKWLDKVRPDIIHLHNWHFTASPSIIRLAKKRGIPVVQTLHNYRLLCPSGTMLINNKLSCESHNGSFPWNAVFNRAYHNSAVQTFWLGFTVWANKVAGTWQQVDKYIVFTDHAKKIFQQSKLMSKDKIVVKPNFIADIPTSKKVRKQHFLFVGRLSEEKGIDVLLKSVANSKHQLKIIGEGPLQNLVEDYSKKYNNIAYLGFNDKTFIINELKTCTALIFPSIWYEGNPLTIIEALACSTPVIASDMGAMQSMITNGYNGLHFEPGNETDLNQTLNYWHQLPAFQKEDFYTNARFTFEDTYTPEKNFEQIISLYNSVLHEGKVKPVELVY